MMPWCTCLVTLANWPAFPISVALRLCEHWGALWRRQSYCGNFALACSVVGRGRISGYCVPAIAFRLTDRRHPASGSSVWPPRLNQALWLTSYTALDPGTRSTTNWMILERNLSFKAKPLASAPFEALAAFERRALNTTNAAFALEVGRNHARRNRPVFASFRSQCSRHVGRGLASRLAAPGLLVPHMA